MTLIASIEKRGPNSWRIGQLVTTDEGRKWVRRTLTFPASMPEKEQRHAVEVAMARLIIEVEEGKESAGRRRTLRDLAVLWMENHVKLNCEPATIKTYRNFWISASCR